MAYVALSTVGTGSVLTSAGYNQLIANNVTGHPTLSTTDRTALSLGAGDNGTMVYDTTLNQFYMWNGSSWVAAFWPTVNGSALAITGTAGITGLATAAGLVGGTGSFLGLLNTTGITGSTAGLTGLATAAGFRGGTAGFLASSSGTATIVGGTETLINSAGTSTFYPGSITFANPNANAGAGYTGVVFLAGTTTNINEFDTVVIGQRVFS
jgi:hypothetical protein